MEFQKSFLVFEFVACSWKTETKPFFHRVQPDKIRLGDRNPFTKVDDEIAQQFDIIEIVRHPDYKSSTSYNDIALFKMSGTIRSVNPHTKPAKQYALICISFIESKENRLTSLREKLTARNFVFLLDRKRMFCQPVCGQIPAIHL